MRYIHRVVFCLMAGFLLAGPTPGKAVVGPITFRGGSASPMSPHNSIRLDSQEVIIRLKTTRYTVDATFRFFNTGGQSTEWVGFPKFGAGFPSGSLDLIRFQAWINGREEGFSEKHHFLKQQGMFSEPRPVPPYQTEYKWMAKQVTFPGNAKTTIRIRYEAHYEPLAGGGRARYIYGTGTYWKGKIGKAGFVIDATDIGGTKHIFTEFRSNPGSRLMSENVIRHEISDFEPWPEATLEIRYYRDWTPLVPSMQPNAASFRDAPPHLMPVPQPVPVPTPQPMGIPAPQPVPAPQPKGRE